MQPERGELLRVGSDREGYAILVMVEQPLEKDIYQRGTNYVTPRVNSRDGGCHGPWSTIMSCNRDGACSKKRCPKPTRVFVGFAQS